MADGKPRVLVSACLLGVACRYDGCSKPNEAVQALKEVCELIPVCPEQLGGLPTPRPPAERQGERVCTAAGADVTAEYLRGGQQAVFLAKQFGCKAAVLKQKSPACGSGQIYDGSFSGTLCRGDGVAAELLRKEGLAVTDEMGAAALYAALLKGEANEK